MAENTPRFTLESGDQAAEYYNQNGYFILNAGNKFLDELIQQIQELTELKSRLLKIPNSTEKKSLGLNLMNIKSAGREYLAHIYDAANTLPSLQALNQSSIFVDAMKMLRRYPYNLMDVPRLRMDLPDENKFATVEHQESYYHDTPGSSINAWFALNDITEEMGPLKVRPGSHHLGRLDVEHRPEERPFFFLKPGEWETKFQLISVPVKAGEIIFFHNNLIHIGGINIAKEPRISVQVRFNYLADPDYLKFGWPRTYRIKERYEKEINYQFS